MFGKIVNLVLVCGLVLSLAAVWAVGDVQAIGITRTGLVIRDIGTFCISRPIRSWVTLDIDQIDPLDTNFRIILRANPMPGGGGYGEVHNYLFKPTQNPIASTGGSGELGRNRTLELGGFYCEGAYGNPAR